MSDLQVVQPYGQVAIDLDGGQLIGEKRLFAVLFQFFGERLGSSKAQRGDPFQVAIDGLQPAPHALQQANGGFFSYAGHARNVVHLVTHQREEVDDQRGRQPKFLLDASLIQGLFLHGIDQRDMAVHQLGHVLVAGGDHRVAPGLGGVMRQRADDIVGFDAFDAQQRQPQRFHAGV